MDICTNGVQAKVMGNILTNCVCGYIYTVLGDLNYMQLNYYFNSLTIICCDLKVELHSDFVLRISTTSWVIFCSLTTCKQQFWPIN